MSILLSVIFGSAWHLATCFSNFSFLTKRLPQIRHWCGLLRKCTSSMCRLVLAGRENSLPQMRHVKSGWRWWEMKWRRKQRSTARGLPVEGGRYSHAGHVVVRAGRKWDKSPGPGRNEIVQTIGDAMLKEMVWKCSSFNARCNCIVCLRHGSMRQCVEKIPQHSNASFPTI